MENTGAAIVTGASSGIGAAVARELAVLGFRVLLTARRQRLLEERARELPGSAWVAGDLAGTGMPEKVLAACLEEFGRCDLVFNGAGVMHTGTIEDADLDALAAMLRINLEAVVRMSYVALRHFRRSGSGHLINVSSILGTKVRPTAGVYAASKHALEALSEALRIEVARSRIKVSVLEPGLVETGLQDHFPVHPRELLGIEKPLQPGDVARAVRFLVEQPEHVRIPVLMILPGEQEM